MSAETVVAISGTGLITGQESVVSLSAGEPGSGIVFYVEDTVIPATPNSVINTDRGVTLGRDGKMLAIVEHFLAACAMTHRTDLAVHVSGAPELPLLDGSSQDWVPLLDALPESRERSPLRLNAPVVYATPEKPGLELVAIPSDTLEITYMVNFPHPDMAHKWVHWHPSQGTLLEWIAPARTFGFAAELPALQARGLALGVTMENTIGLTEEGGYTTELRFEGEPLRHKILDLIGDLMLCGVPIQRLSAKVFVRWGGHTAHLAFGRLLHDSLVGAGFPNS